MRYETPGKNGLAESVTFVTFRHRPNSKRESAILAQICMAAFEQARSPRTELEVVWREHIHAVSSGKQEALAALYDASSNLVYSIALRILGNAADAEEVTLDTYTQVWRTAPTFDAQRGSAISWLATIVRSRAIDRRRALTVREQRREPLADVAGTEPPDTAVAHTVENALKSLPAEQRELIELAYWYGYSHSELSDRLGLPLGTIKTRIRTGMLKLRSQLGEL